jgi:WD40 repeat protein
VQHLADQRLVVTGRDEAGAETAEVVHEVLIQGWWVLRGWMEADRAFRTWQERLRAALRGWELSEGDEGALLRGAPLVEAEGWLAERGGELSPEESDYIEAGITLRKRRQAERGRRRRRIIAGLSIGLVLALALALLAGQQWWRAEAEEQEALRQASIGLASQALTELDGKFPERAVPLALEALDDYPYTWQAERALGQAVVESRLQFVLSGHTRVINELYWSPDGKLIATAADDSTAIVWDGRTGERLSTLVGHTHDVVFSPTWSPDSKRIATASWDGTAKVWDVSTGEELASLEKPVNWIVWSPSGERIVTTSVEDTMARVWDPATGQELFTLSGGGQAPMWHVAWSQSGSQIATTDLAGGVKVWDSETGAELLSLDGHEDWVNMVSWSPTGDRIATASDDYTARVWDAATGEELQVLTGHTYKVWFAWWSPAGDRIATASPDATARVWDPDTGEAIVVFDPGDPPFAPGNGANIDWSPSSDRVAISRPDASVTVLDAASGVELLTLTGHAGYIMGLDWSPTGDLIVTGGEDGTARVWDVSPRAQVLAGHTDIACAAWSPSGDRLATASADGTTRIWDMSASSPTYGEELLLMTSRAGLVDVWWSPSGDRLATKTLEDLPIQIQVWDASPSSPTYGQELLAIEDYANLSQVSWSPTGDRFVTGSPAEGWSRIWDASASSPTYGEELFRLEGHDAVDTAWSPDGQRIVTGTGPGYGLVWDAETGQVLSRLQVENPQGWMTRAVWSPDGKRIATHSDDTVGGRIWDASTGELLQTFSGHTGSVWSIDWSAGGDLLLTACVDGTAKIWDAQTGVELLTYSFGGAVGRSEWSPAMEQIAFGQEDGTVWIVDVNWQTREELITYARECCLIRELTEDERELFGLPPR